MRVRPHGDRLAVLDRDLAGGGVITLPDIAAVVALDSVDGASDAAERFARDHRPPEGVERVRDGSDPTLLVDGTHCVLRGHSPWYELVEEEADDLTFG